MKSIKRSLCLALALLICLCFTPAAFAMVEQSDSFYVADDANVISDSTEQTIIRYNAALEQQCRGAQIVVVTTGYLDGMKSDEYAYKLFNDWGVGSAEANNGMLLLLAVNENKAWLAYGLGLTAQLSSDDVDVLMDRYFWPDFDKGYYDSAVSKLFSALVSFYDGVYGTNLSSSTSQNSRMSGAAYDGLARLVRTLIIIAVLIALFGGSSTRGGRGGSWLPWFLLFNSMSRGRGYRGGGFGGGMGRGGGGFGGGFGGGMGRGGGGFSGGGGGRR